MTLPKPGKRTIDLEKDWVLTKEDLGVMGKPIPREPEDLSSYLDFLDLLWRSEKRIISSRFYSDQFRL